MILPRYLLLRHAWVLSQHVCGPPYLSDRRGGPERNRHRDLYELVRVLRLIALPISN
jgi:hypothetical protein